MSVKLTGVFSWPRAERITDRYGAFGLFGEDYENTCKVKPERDLAGVKRLEGKQVHITCRVLESRKSGHIGDLFRGLFPSQPEVGEVVDLGQGFLRLEPDDEGYVDTFISLVPSRDGVTVDRHTDWFDPEKLYRLHDQTVEVMIEEACDLSCPHPPEARVTYGRDVAAPLGRESDTVWCDLCGERVTS